MAKTRLTKADREAIRAAIIAYRFTPLEAAHKAEGEALALQVRSRAYGDFLKVMEAAPSGAFYETRSIKVAISGKRVQLTAAVPVRVWSAHRGGWNDTMLSVSDSDALGAKILSWAERGEGLKAERQHLATVTDGTLAAFNSFEDLQKGWPEAERFIAERWQARPSHFTNVPAVAIRDLSAALDLPPEVAEAA